MNADLHGPWSAIRRSPMLRLATPFITGILLAWGFDPPVLLSVVLMAVLSLSTVGVLLERGHFFERWQRGAVQFGWFVALGLCWSTLRAPEHDPAGLYALQDRTGPWLMRVAAINGNSARTTSCDLQVLAQREERGLRPLRGSLLATLMRDTLGPALEVGDIVVVQAPVERIERRPDPGGFDRGRWAASRGIGHELFAPRGSWSVIGHRWHWTDVFRDARVRISTWLNGSDLRLRERALVKALVLGEREELEGDQRDAFVRSGTIHVIAVSGMHVGLIYVVLTFLFRWWGKGRTARWTKGVLVLIVLWSYTGLTGASPSVLRAAVMFSLFTIADLGRQRSDNLNNLFAAALVLLVWDPAMLQQAGFQLSFLAVLGIILFFRPIERLWTSRWWLLRQGWSLAALSLAAQVLTTPVSLQLFKAFPVWFLPANLVVVTATTIAVYGGILLIALYRVPWVGLALTWAMTMLLRFVDMTTSFFASLPGAYPAVRVELVDMIVLYVLILSLGAWLSWRWLGAWRVVLASILALFGIWGYRAHERISHDSLVVYDQRQGFLAGMVHGRELVVIASSDSLFSSAYTRAKIERHQRVAGIDTTILVPARSAGALAFGHTVRAGDRWRSSRSNVRFLNDDSDPDRSSAACDVVIAHDLHRLDQAGVEDLRTAKQIVIAGEVGYAVREKLRKLAAGQHVSLHEVRRQGAFILEQ